MSRTVSNLLVVAMAAGGLLTLAGCGGAAQAPTSYTKYNAKESAFSIDYPAGWSADGGGKGNQWAKFSQGSALIKVQTDLTGSLMADIVGSGGNMQVKIGDDEDITEAAVHKVHLMNTDKMNEEFSGYQEKEPVKVMTGLGDGRKSEFTAAGGLGGEIRGYRATVLSNQKRIQVVCSCSGSDWQVLQPAFDKVIESVGRGS